MTRKDDDKIELAWTILCEKSVIDSESNNLSLQNVIEEVQLHAPRGAKLGDEVLSKEKVAPFNFELITFWRKLAKDREISKEIQVEVFDPDGKSLGKVGGPLKIAKEHRRLRHRIRFNTIKATIPGEYTFLVSAREDSSGKFE